MKKIKVLFVDDDAKKWIIPLKSNINPEEIEIEYETQATNTLERLRNGNFDVLLLDLDFKKNQLEIREGKEILVECKKEFPDLPVIIFTGSFTPDTADECIKKNAFEYITKYPLDYNKLYETIKKAAEIKNNKNI